MTEGATPPPDEIAGLIDEFASLIGDPAVDVALSPFFMAARKTLRSLAQENERLHERLEDNHEFELKDGQMLRSEVAPGSIPDGIECRDETIKLKRERIAELEAENDRLRESVNAVRAEYLQRYMNATARIIELEAERTESGK